MVIGIGVSPKDKAQRPLSKVTSIRVASQRVSAMDRAKLRNQVGQLIKADGLRVSLKARVRSSTLVAQPM